MFTITAEICDPVQNSLVADHLLQTKEELSGERAYEKYEDKDEDEIIVSVSSVSPTRSEITIPELESKRSRSYSRTGSPNMLKVPIAEERVRIRSRSCTLVKKAKHNRDDSIPEHFKLSVHNYLVNLYTQHGAGKKECARVPGLMEKYKNREQELLRKVMRHYKVAERKLEVPAIILEILCE